MLQRGYSCRRLVALVEGPVFADFLKIAMDSSAVLNTFREYTERIACGVRAKSMTGVPWSATHMYKRHSPNPALGNV